MNSTGEDNPGRRLAEAALRCFAVVALIGALVAVGWAPAAHAAPDESKGANRFGACLASQKAGDLLLLFDESSSLQQTDRDASRVRASKPLLETLGRYADRVKANLDVSAAGFAENYVPEKDWTPLTADSADPTAAQLSGIASKNTGIDTDYWMAVDGARQAMAARDKTQGGGERCQAIAWFSDGKIDYTARPLTKPYAGVSLDSPDGVEQTRKAAIDSICRPGGLADQVRSSNIVLLGIGLGGGNGGSATADFDVMSAISTGKGLNGMTCGKITDPVPGDFYPVANIDDMLFAFDSLNPDPGVNQQGPVCQLQVCPEARHNFVVDRSIKSVTILGSGGVAGVVPYLISPSGQTLALPKKDGKIAVNVDGNPVSYEWQSESAQTISIQNSGPGWVGQWAIVYVDTTGQHADAVSRVNIHITTDIFPALVGLDKLAWHSGQVLKGLKFGLVDGQGATVAAGNLAGAASLSTTLVPDGAAPIPLLDSVAKDGIGAPVDVDLTKVNPGHAALRMSLVITTAPTADPQGAPIAGTELSPQHVDVPIQILPKVGLPTPGKRIDFGSVEAAKGATATLDITGPGCAWIADSDTPAVVAAPDEIGATHVTSPANSAGNCLKVPAGQTAQLQVTLRTEHDGHGGLNGNVPLHVAALANTGDSQVVQVPFVASLTKSLDTMNFVLVLIAALLLGPGIPLALLYASKWWVSKIPATPMLAERISVEVSDDLVLRDGEPFALADTDLLQPVAGLGGGARALSVLGVALSVKTGRSPFGAGHVAVDAKGYLSVGSELPGSDSSGLRAVLPLAVHNKWVVLHDPRGPATAAEVLLLVGGNTDMAARERIYEEIARQLPELLNGLRARAAQAGMVAPGGGRTDSSPFGGDQGAPNVGFDPFGAGVGRPGPAAPNRDRGRAPGPDPFAASGSAGGPDPFAGAGFNGGGAGGGRGDRGFDAAGYGGRGYGGHDRGFDSGFDVDGYGAGYGSGGYETGAGYDGGGFRGYDDRGIDAANFDGDSGPATGPVTEPDPHEVTQEAPISYQPGQRAPDERPPVAPRQGPPPQAGRPIYGRPPDRPPQGPPPARGR